MLQDKLGPSQIVLFFLQKLKTRIETNASRGIDHADLYIPESAFGQPKYNRQYVAEQVLRMCQMEGYEDAMLGEWDWTIKVTFSLKPHEKLHFPKNNNGLFLKL
jgi:hypothetical protein